MTFEEAVAAEQSDRLIEAADLYESLLKQDQPPLGALLNLAVLYWQVTDYGFWTNRGLPQDFVTRAGKRFPEVLARAREIYPKSTDARFWTKYIDWADLGESLSFDECAALIQDDPKALTPVLFLFGQSEGNEYEAEALELLRRSKERHTTLDRYVESVLEGVFMRRKK